MSLRHAILLAPLNTLNKMPSEMASATTRKSRILLMAMEAGGSIPDLLTINHFVELLKVLPDFRGGRSI